MRVTLATGVQKEGEGSDMSSYRGWLSRGGPLALQVEMLRQQVLDMTCTIILKDKPGGCALPSMPPPITPASPMVCRSIYGKPMCMLSC